MARRNNESEREREREREKLHFTRAITPRSKARSPHFNYSARPQDSMPRRRPLAKKFELLRALARIKDRGSLSVIIRYLDLDAVSVLGELLWNVLYNKKLQPTAPLRQRLRAIFARDKKGAVYFADKRKSASARKRRIVQRGGFLGTLIAGAVPLIISLLTQHAATRSKRGGRAGKK